MPPNLPDLTGDRGFESSSLQRRVGCEPDFLRDSAGPRRPRTAERGGGLVCWLESLRALIAAPPACDVVFTANSGHELGHLGLDDFMARRPGWERPISEGGATWIHFGANIGAANGELSLQAASDDLRQLTAAELVRAGQAPDVVAPKTLVPSGETR